MIDAIHTLATKAQFQTPEEDVATIREVTAICFSEPTEEERTAAMRRVLQHIAEKSDALYCSRCKDVQFHMRYFEDPSSARYCIMCGHVVGQ